jgi:hypothetical protein
MPTRTHAFLVGTAIALTMIPGFLDRFFAAMGRRAAVAHASGSSSGTVVPTSRSGSS